MDSLSGMRRQIAIVLATICLGLAGWLFAEQTTMKIKAILADRLIDAAWEAHLADGTLHRPWAWADTHPLARLEVKRLGVRRMVLAGASGTSLAFGLGHVDGTALPNEHGNTVLGGHRNTRFAFLADLRRGDRIVITTRGRIRQWEVGEMAVVGADHSETLQDDGRDRLTLVTCFPVNGVRPSDQRFVVIAFPVPQEFPGSADMAINPAWSTDWNAIENSDQRLSSWSQRSPPYR